MIVEDINRVITEKAKQNGIIKSDKITDFSEFDITDMVGQISTC